MKRTLYGFVPMKRNIPGFSPVTAGFSPEKAGFSPEITGFSPGKTGFAPGKTGFVSGKRNITGFTLAELLIVVAIIAVLVAVSMPIFSSRLERSRESTDMANMRSAKAVAAVALMEEQYSSGDNTYYDADRGILVSASDTNLRNIIAYGKGTSVVGDEANVQDQYDPAESYYNGVILVSFRQDRAYLEWVSKSSGRRLNNTDAVVVGDSTR